MSLGTAIASALETWLDHAQSMLRLGRASRSGPDQGRPGAVGIADRPCSATEHARFGRPFSAGGRTRTTRANEQALPAAYGYDRIVLLVRDPWSAFAYWEVTPATRTDAQRRLGRDGASLRPTLRLYEAGTSDDPGGLPLHWSDIDVPAGVESWPVKLPHPDTTYFVEVGVRTSDNQLYVFARSASTRAPRSTTVADDSTTWITVAPTPPVD